MLSKQEYEHYFLVKLREYAPAEFDVQEIKIQKINQTETGISFGKDGVGVVIYPNDYCSSAQALF